MHQVTSTYFCEIKYEVNQEQTYICAHYYLLYLLYIKLSYVQIKSLMVYNEIF